MPALAAPEEDSDVSATIEAFLSSKHSVKRKRGLRALFVVISRQLASIKRGRQPTPAVLRHKHVHFSDIDTPLPLVQLVSERQHLAPVFPYPAWLAEYGITRDDWLSFTARIFHCRHLKPWQVFICFSCSLFADVMASFHFPSRLLGLFLLPPAPMALYFKRHNLRRAMRNGHLESWVAYWNYTYFGPKGLVIGFDLPGPVFKAVPVHPSLRTSGLRRTCMGSGYRTKTPAKAAKRTRVTIARVHDPEPSRGRPPRITPLPTPNFEKCK